MCAGVEVSVCLCVCVSAADQSKLSFKSICFDFDLSCVCGCLGVCLFSCLICTALGVLTVVHQKTDQNHETLI